MSNYLIKKWYYIIISLIIYFIYLKIFKINFNILEPLLLILLVRFIDDYFDYEKDKGKRIDKKNLIILICFVSLLYIVLNIVLYNYLGLLSIVIVAYFFLMNKIEILKIFSLSLITGYYYLINNDVNYIVLIITLGISIIFYIVKRCKK